MKLPASPDRLYAFIFLLYGLVFTATVIWRLPPFMGPDELNHIKRANLITRGSLIGQRVRVGNSVVAGGRCEVGLDAANSYYQPMEFHPERKVDSAKASAASAIAWGGDSTDQAFENTAVYPPFFYLPQGLAIGLGKLLGLPIVRTIELARIANALFCLVVGYFAVRLAGRSGLMVLTVLLLPMSVALYSSVTQDGGLIVTSALACAFMVRGLTEGRPMTTAETIGAAISLSIVGMAKPPYALLSLLLLLIPTERPNWRWIAACGSIGVAALWHVFMALKVQTPLHRPDAVVDPSGQIGFLLHHPFAAFGVAAATMRHSGGEYAAQLVGVLGWLDTLLPKPYYGAAFLVLAASVALVTSRMGAERKRSLWAVGVLTLTAFAIFGAFYIAYTPVGSAYVEGVQGRYLLPLVAMMPLALIGREPVLSNARLRQALSVVLLIFPPLSLLVVERALTGRYC